MFVRSVVWSVMLMLMVQYNILRKVAPKSLIGSSGTVDVPIRIRILDVKLL